MKGIKLIVSGRVQGVGFRYYTLRKAKEHQISGNVRNLPDGAVKIIAFGKQDNLNSFVSSVQKGPSLAFVSDITADDIEVDTIPEKFSIEY